MCGKINVIYSLLISHLHLKYPEIRFCVMCGKVSFIVHSQRKQKTKSIFYEPAWGIYFPYPALWKELWVFYRFFFFFFYFFVLIVQKHYKLIDSIQCIINWYSK